LDRFKINPDLDAPIKSLWQPSISASHAFLTPVL